MDNSTNSLNGWSEWRNFILAELKRLNGTIEKLEKNSGNHEVLIAVEMAKLKFYATIFGGIAGLIGSLLVMLIYSVVI